MPMQRPERTKNFHAIKVSHGIELLLKQGAEEAMAISAENKEQREAVKTEIVNGGLRIYEEQGWRSGGSS